MTNEDKLDFILNYLNISNKEVARKLEVSDSLVSQWRNKRSKKFKKVHILAFCSEFSIEEKIFTSNINTKESIIEYLSNKNSNISLLKASIKGIWYIYSYEFDKSLKYIKIIIKDNNIFLENKSNSIGYIVNINNEKTLLIFKYNLKAITIIINNDYMNESMFYANLESKNLAHTLNSSIALLSKELIDDNYINFFINREKISINHCMLDNLNKYIFDRKYLVHKFNSKSHIYGEWYLYFQNKYYTLIIEKSDKVYLYNNDSFISKGDIFFRENSIKIKLTNSKSQNSYIYIKEDIEVFNIVSFVGYQEITNNNILEIAILSKKRLDPKDIKVILGSNSYLIENKFKNRLFNYLLVKNSDTKKVKFNIENNIF